MQIILDTNVLIYAAKNKLDIVEEFKRKFGLSSIYASNLVINELKQLKASGKKSDREIASLALDILRQKKLPTVELQGPTDEALVDWAHANQAAVLTNDVELKFKAREAGLVVYHLRQGKLIEQW